MHIFMTTTTRMNWDSSISKVAGYRLED